MNENDKTNPDETQETPTVVVVKPGTVYQVRLYRIMCRYKHIYDAGKPGEKLAGYYVFTKQDLDELREVTDLERGRLYKLLLRKGYTKDELEVIRAQAIAGEGEKDGYEL